MAALHCTMPTTRYYNGSLSIVPYQQPDTTMAAYLLSLACPTRYYNGSLVLYLATTRYTMAAYVLYLTNNQILQWQPCIVPYQQPDNTMAALYCTLSTTR